MFSDKLKKLFRRDGKEKLKIEYASPKNEYYGRVSERYSSVQMILVLFLTLFVLVSFFFGIEWISYENIGYFFSDLGNYITSADADIESVVYDTGSFYSFGMFGGKLAVAGGNGVTVYTASGRTVFDDTEALGNPKIEVSERNMLVYDAGGTEYRLYNLFTEVYSEKTENAIYGAATADNGSYAIITGGDVNHISYVKLYNRRFREIQTIGRGSYVIDVSMSPSGDRTAVLSYTEENGEFKTILYLTKTGKTEGYAEISLTGSFPLYCALTEKGDVTLVCDNRILSYDTKGRLIDELVYPDGYILKDAECNRYGAVAVLYGSGKNITVVFDRNGNLMYNEENDAIAVSTAICGDYVFLLGNDSLTRINYNNGKRQTVARNTESEVYMTVKNEDEVLLCMQSSVRYIDFDT